MNDIRLKIAPVLLFLALIQPTLAGAPPVTAPMPLDEVLIEGKRATTNELVQQIVKVENRFYERYNELNDNDDFDVHCVLEARAGTRLQGRSCRAVYQDKAERAEGQASYWWYYETFDLGGVAAGPNAERKPERAASAPVPAMLSILARRDEFRRNMAEVTNLSPELIRLLRQRAELLERYKASLLKPSRP